MSSPERGKLDSEDLLAYLLLGLPLLALMITSGKWLFLSAWGVALVLHPLLVGRVQLRLGLVGYAALGLPLALLFQLWEVSGVGGSQFHNAFYFGLGGLTYGLAFLYGRRTPTRLAWILFLGGCVLTASGLGLPLWVGDSARWQASFPAGWSPRPTRFYGLCTGAFGVLVLLVVRHCMHPTGKRPPAPPGLKVGVAAFFALAAALTLGMIYLADRYYDDLNAIYLKMAHQSRLRSSAGFSGVARLGNVVSMHDSAQAKKITLRAFSRQAPGYMRGKAFMGYERGSWSTGPDAAEAQVHQVKGGRYQLRERPLPAPDQAPEMTVYPASDYSAHLFLPTQASALDLSLACKRILVAPGQTLRSGDEPTTAGYDVYTSPEPWHHESALEGFLKLPGDPQLMGELDRLLEQLELTPESDTAQATHTLMAHFQRKYTYKFGIKFEDGPDPLYQFLTAKSHGHCELFASAGTLLLRRLGIRARYVTGFLCHEKNPWGDLFLARSGDAHAWVEYHDPDKGWRVAEFTPPSGMPTSQVSGRLEALLDWAGGLWDRTVGMFRNGMAGLPARVWAELKAFFAWLGDAWWRVGALILLVGLYLMRGLFGRRRRPSPTRHGIRALSPELQALRARYLELERRLAKQHLGRNSWETLLEYAARLEQSSFPAGEDPLPAVSLVREFAQHRYSPHTTLVAG